MRWAAAVFLVGCSSSSAVIVELEAGVDASTADSSAPAVDAAVRDAGTVLEAAVEACVPHTCGEAQALYDQPPNRTCNRIPDGCGGHVSCVLTCLYGSCQDAGDNLDLCSCTGVRPSPNCSGEYVTCTTSDAPGHGCVAQPDGTYCCP